jgi:hypothetical protein
MLAVCPSVMRPTRTRRRVIAALAVALGVSASSGVTAMWQKLTLEQLVEASVLVVSGELIEIRPRPEGPTDLAVLQIDEVLHSRTERPAPLEELLLVVPSARGPMASDRVTYRVGQRGVWLLRAGADAGTYAADHPQRWQAMSEIGSIRAVLRARARI